MLNKNIDYKLSKYKEKLSKTQNGEDEKRFSLYSKKVKMYKSLYQIGGVANEGEDEDVINTFDVNTSQNNSTMTDADTTVRRYLDRKTLTALFGEDGSLDNYKDIKYYTEVEYLLENADSADNLKNQLNAVFNSNKNDDYNYKPFISKLGDADFDTFVRGFKVLNKLKNDSDAPKETDINDLYKLADDAGYRELIKSLINNMEKHKDEWSNDSTGITKIDENFFM
jgi:hypothetical protein